MSDVQKRRVEDLQKNMPAWMRFIIQIGIIPAIALGLTYYITIRIDKRLDDIETHARIAHETMERAEKTMGSFAEDQRDYQAKLVEQIGRQIIILRQICINQSDSTKAMEICKAQ